MYKNKTCATCAISINGRKDKIFCSKECQNAHHKIAKAETAVIHPRKNNKFIKRNYIVLRGLMGSSTKRVYIHRDTLFKYGFNQNHFLKRVKRNKTVFYLIREYQFRYVGHGRYEVIRNSKGPSYSIEFLSRWNREFGANMCIYRNVEIGFDEGSGRSSYHILEFNDFPCLVTKALLLLRGKVYSVSKTQ